MVIIFRRNVLILINIFRNISQLLGKLFRRLTTNVLCLLGYVVVVAVIVMYILTVLKTRSKAKRAAGSDLPDY